MKYINLLLLVTTSLLAQSPQTISMSAPPPTAPTNISVQVVGGASNTYYYWVVANYPIGNIMTPTPTVAYNAPTTFSVSSYVNIGWSAQTGASSYDVLRTTTTTPPTGTTNSRVALGITVTSFKDTISTPVSYTLTSASGFNGAISVDNTNSSVPLLLWSLPRVYNLPVGILTFSDGTTQTTAGGGGGGIVVVTTGAIDPSGSCTSPSTSSLSQYYNTVTFSFWTCIHGGWLQNTLIDPNAIFLITGNVGTAPGTPSTGKVNFYSDANKGLLAKDDAGNVTRTVKATDCSGTGFLQKINADGSVTCAAGGGSSSVTCILALGASQLAATSSWYQCLNTSGVTRTITGIHCLSVGSAIQVQGLINGPGTGGGGVGITTSAITCGNNVDAWTAGTLVNTVWSNTNSLGFTVHGDGVATSFTVQVDAQ